MGRCGRRGELTTNGEIQTGQGAHGSRVGRKLAELFGMDLRSMALFRVGLGIMLLLDLLKRTLAFTAHYTGEGIVPKEQIEDYLHVLPIFRLYMISDEPAFQASLFVIQGLAALCLMVGYRTRLMSFISLYMLICLQRRNPFVCHTGGWWLLVLTLWSVVLPLGAAYSVDQLRKARRPALRSQYLSFGTLGYALQLVCFYYMAGWFKHREPVWQSGEAVAAFTQIDSYVTWFGSLLGTSPGLGRFFTHYTLALESYGWVLFFLPFFTPVFRMVGILLFASFHLGLHLAVYIGILELLSIVALFALLPASFWDVVLPRIPVPRGVARLWQSWARRCQSYARPPSSAPVPAWTRGARVAEQGLAAALMVAVLFFNNDSRRGSLNLGYLSPGVETFVRSTGIAQHWIIFTDLDERPNGWFLVLGEREDGEVINMLTEEVFRSIDKPERPGAFFENHNMRRLWHLAALERFRGLRPLLGDYLCRDWNKNHEQRVDRVIVFTLEGSPPPGVRPPMLPVVEHKTEAARPGKAAWIAFYEEINARMTAGPGPPRG